MESALLRRLLSLDNTFNKRYGASFPLYKFHRLYEDRTGLSDEERRSRLFVDNQAHTGLHVLNPFFVSLLREHAIWFAPSNHFNDPWDAGHAVSILRTGGEVEEPILKLILGEDEFARMAGLPEGERYPQIEDKLREVFGLLRFACFTKRHDSNPMWAHYADDHRGVCLEFRFMKALPEGTGPAYAIDPGFVGHYPIRYGADFASIGDINDIGSAIKILHTKHSDWAYEQEVRFIKVGDPDHPGIGGTVSFYKTSLTKVILGCKVPPVLWRVVETLLDEFDYPHTELQRAEFDSRTQSLRYLTKTRKSSA